jgi:hypothetical protein
MKKTVILVAAMLMLVSPVLAQQAKRQARASKTNPTAAKLLNAYNRMNHANKQSGAPSPSGQTQSLYGSLANVNPALPGSSPPANALTPPAGDRPFDANASTINPFALTATSPGSLLSPPFMPGPGVDPFGPSQFTVNPFIPGGPTAANLFSANVPNAAPNVVNNPGNSLSAIQSAARLNKSRQLQLHPVEGLMQINNQFTVSPYDSVSVFNPMAALGNAYSLDYLFPTSSLRRPTSP